MASTFPTSTAQNHTLTKRSLLTTPAPPFLLLLLLLLLSFFLALFLLHINNLLLLSLSHRPPLLHHFLSPSFTHHQGPLSSSTLVQHYLSFLLSPFSIFILANLIIFTLLFKTFYLSSSPSTSLSSTAALSDFSDFTSEKFDYGGPTLPEYVVRRHEDFFFSSPPPARYILSSDPSEEYHILSFGSNEESTYLSLNKLNNEWEDVQSVYLGTSYNESSVGNGVLPQKEAKRQDKVQANITEKVAPNQEGRAAEKGGKVDGKTSKPLKGTAASHCSTPMRAPTPNQAVVINMEPAPAMATRRPRTSTPPSHPPPPATPAQLQPATVKVNNPSPSLYQPTTKVTHPPPTPQQPTIKLVTHPASPPSRSSMQRPPSSPKAKKSTGLLAASAPTSDQSRSGGASNAKPLQILDTDKLQAAAAKPTQVKRSTIQHQSNMTRSYSDQRLSQQLLRSPDVIANHNASSSSSLTNRPHVQKAPRGRSAIDNLLTSSSSFSATSRPRMQRTQSLKASSSPYRPADDYTKPPSSPTFSEAFDALSDADANKRFSNFIAHRFSRMKKELDVHST